MTDQQHDPTPTPPDEDDTSVPGRGDDERRNREKIEDTGEPETDALGNADGAS